MKKHELQTAFSTRQYMVSKDFEIYYYSDTNIAPVKAHEHNYYEFYFFIEGSVSLCINSDIFSLKQGDIIIIPPRTSHYPIISPQSGAYRRFVLWVSIDYINQLTSASVDYAYIFQRISVNKEYIFHTSFTEFNSIQSYIFNLIEEIKNERFGKSAQISLLINGLLLYINRLLYNRNVNNSNNQRELYLRICDYIENNLENDISLKAISDEFFLSKYYISHHFKENMGISIHKYITKKRLEACRSAFLSGLKISEACKLFGFYDYSAFYRAFKKEYGISPSDYILNSQI